MECPKCGKEMHYSYDGSGYFCNICEFENSGDVIIYFAEKLAEQKAEIDRLKQDSPNAEYIKRGELLSRAEIETDRLKLEIEKLRDDNAKLDAMLINKQVENDKYYKDFWNDISQRKKVEKEIKELKAEIEKYKQRIKDIQGYCENISEDMWEEFIFYIKEICIKTNKGE